MPHPAAQATIQATPSIPAPRRARRPNRNRQPRWIATNQTNPARHSSDAIQKLSRSPRMWFE
jgi:hypothetical protein